MVKVYINDNEIEFKYGFPTEDILQNTLDSGTITIPHTDIEIKPKDEVIIERDSVNSYFYVSLVKKTIVSFNPEKYNYVLSLISPVIELQRIVLPNRSITQPFTYTKTIYDVLSNYIEIYAQGLKLSNEFISRFDAIQAPELKWEQPTLYEVFNDLLEFDGCIVTMTDFETISFLDLSVRNNEIDVSTISDIYSEQSLEDYASDLDVDAKNVVYDTENFITYANIALKTDDTILTVDNSKLILPKNIYTINEFNFRWRYVDSESQTRVLELDLTNFLVEKTVYDNYKSSNSLGLVTGDYKRNALYYVEGKNTIEGFGYSEDSFLGITTYRAITNIVRNEIDRLGLDHDFTNSDILDTTYSIKYTTKEDVRFVQRKENSEYLGTLINNQEVSSVDLKAFAKKNQELANRLENESLSVNFNKFYDYNDIPKKGDTYGDYVLTSREVYSFYDYYVVKGLLTANYVMQDVTEALKQSKRYTSIATESFESNHLSIYEIVATTTEQQNYSTFENYLNNFGKSGYAIDMAKAYITTTSSFFTLAMPVSVFAKKNSILVTYEMVDNYSAGISAEQETLFLGIDGAISMLDIPYVDENGEFEAIETTLYYNKNDNRVPDFVIGEDLSYIERTRNLPAVDDDFNFSEEVFKNLDKLRYKDNREKTKETIEFIFEEDDVFIGDEFINNNTIVSKYNSDIILQVRYSTTETYTKYDKNVAKGTVSTNIVRVGNSIRSSLSEEDWNSLDIKSWCVCDLSGKVYLATNSKNRFMYLVFKKDVRPIELGESIFKLEADLTYHRSKDIGFDLNAQFGLEARLTYHRSKDIGFDLLPIFGLNADLDYHRSKDIGYDLLASFGLSASMTYTVYNPSYEWVSGGTPPTTGTTCNGPEDVGNVKCENVCSFDVTGTFTTFIDVSTPKPACTVGATYTSCRLLGNGQYFCTDRIGVTETVCETCELVEE